MHSSMSQPVPWICSCPAGFACHAGHFLRHPVRASQAFDELLLLMRGGRTIYWGPLGPQASQLFQYFEVHLSS